MATQIYSKKTNAELIALTADVVAHKAEYDAREVVVDASLNAMVAQSGADKAEIDASLNAIVASADAEKARVALRESAVDASFNAVASQAVADKAELVGSIATEKATLQANIDALAVSSTGASGALTSRVNDLEAKVGADLTATINTALSDGVVQATLDGFLAKDTELASALTTAIGERTSADDAIKAKFDLLVDTLFEGLTFEGVEKASLKFGSDAVVFDGIIKAEHIGLWFGNKWYIANVTPSGDVHLKIDTESGGRLTGMGVGSMWDVPFNPATQKYEKVDYGLSEKFELIDGVLYFAGLPETDV